MQDRKKDTDVYNGLLDSEGEGEGGMISIFLNLSSLDFFYFFILFFFKF